MTKVIVRNDEFLFLTIAKNILKPDSPAAMKRHHGTNFFNRQKILRRSWKWEERL